MAVSARKESKESLHETLSLLHYTRNLWNRMLLQFEKKMENQG